MIEFASPAIKLFKLGFLHKIYLLAADYVGMDVEEVTQNQLGTIIKKEESQQAGFMEINNGAILISSHHAIIIFQANISHVGRSSILLTVKRNALMELTINRINGTLRVSISCHQTTKKFKLKL